MTIIAALLTTLEDPFVLFPLEVVSRKLEDILGGRDDRMAGRTGWWGVSSRYRPVDEQHDLEVIRLFIGSAFVLGQSAIAQTLSVVTRFRVLAGDPPWLPNGKIHVLSLEANVHPATGLSTIALYDAVANYVTHHNEWPSEWDSATVAQHRTIHIVLKLGLVPEGKDNLHVALQNLGLSVTNLSQMGIEIQEWRERLAVSLRKQLHDHGLS